MMRPQRDIQRRLNVPFCFQPLPLATHRTVKKSGKIDRPESVCYTMLKRINNSTHPTLLTLNQNQWGLFKYGNDYFLPHGFYGFESGCLFLIKRGEDGELYYRGSETKICSQKTSGSFLDALGRYLIVTEKEDISKARWLYHNHGGEFGLPGEIYEDEYENFKEFNKEALERLNAN